MAGKDGKERGKAPKAKAARILVVDDEPSVLLTYRLLLEQKGYDTVALGSAREAIESLQREGYDLLLCDLSLEEQANGFDVIEAARNRAPGTKAALLTGYASVEAAERAGKNDIAILFKPIDIDQFFETISVLLGEQPNGQAKANGE